MLMQWHWVLLLVYLIITLMASKPNVQGSRKKTANQINLITELI